MPYKAEAFHKLKCAGKASCNMAYRPLASQWHELTCVPQFCPSNLQNTLFYNLALVALLSAQTLSNTLVLDMPLFSKLTDKLGDMMKEKLGGHGSSYVTLTLQTTPLIFVQMMNMKAVTARMVITKATMSSKSSTSVSSTFVATGVC